MNPLVFSFLIWRRPLALAVRALLLVAGGTASGLAAGGLRPNIVVILTDDQGYGDLGVTGNPVLETPNLDALARGSASLTQFYVSPVCSPTRASFMTGRYNYRTRVVDTFEGRSMMDPDEVTIAEVLRTAGYATGIFGKWHLGDNYPLRASDQGFEETLLIRGGGLGQSSDPIENRQRYTDPIVFRNNVPVESKGYCTDVFFDAALDFISRTHRKGKPFFVTLTPNAPHGPFHDVPTDLYEKYRAKDLAPVLMGNTADSDRVARIFAMVENIDVNVGRLMTTLRAAALLENTLVVFFNDNGPDGARYVGPMRGRKTEVHDGGIRTPFFVHWPARLKPGTSSDRIAAHIDIFPTLLDAAGVSVPAGLKLDGRNLMPLLQGRAGDWPDRFLILQTHRGDIPRSWHHFAVRTQQWKLVYPSGFSRIAPPAGVPLELYNLTVDPMERSNLVAAEPQVVEHLRQAYVDWFRDVSTTRPDNFAPPRIVIGSDYETQTVLTRQNMRLRGSLETGRVGFWSLRAEREARYALELRWPHPVAPGKLVIQAGGSEQVIEVGEATDQIHLAELRIPAGELDFSVGILRGERRENAYHATLIRSPAL